MLMRWRWTLRRRPRSMQGQMAVACSRARTAAGIGPVSTGLTNAFLLALAIDPATPAILYAGTESGGVFKSTNGGGNWSGNTGLTATYVMPWRLTRRRRPPSMRGHGGGVFKSTNGGGKWSAVNTGLPDYPLLKPWRLTRRRRPPSMWGQARRVQKHERRRRLERGQRRPDQYLCLRPGDRPGDAGHPLCGDKGRRVQEHEWRRDWGAVNTGLTDTFVIALAIDPATPAILYAGTNGGGVFKSTNGGGNWHMVNTGLTDPVVPLWQLTRRRRPPSIQGHMATACSRARTAAGTGARSIPG